MAYSRRMNLFIAFTETRILSCQASGRTCCDFDHFFGDYHWELSSSKRLRKDEGVEMLTYSFARDHKISSTYFHNVSWYLFAQSTWWESRIRQLSSTGHNLLKVDSFDPEIPMRFLTFAGSLREFLRRLSRKHKHPLKSRGETTSERGGGGGDGGGGGGQWSSRHGRCSSRHCKEFYLKVNSRKE